jgi:beta-lactamase superfamily II metal-dependent hydrolase
MPETIRYAGYPDAVVYDDPFVGDDDAIADDVPTNDEKPKPIQHLLWGDWVRVTGEAVEGWTPIHSRGVDGWVKSNRLMKDRLLELVFVDIGQGDGCLLITPEDKHILIDAGQEDNMRRFLRWRYGKFKERFDFEAMIITHPDADHYNGFKDILSEPNVHVGTIYHNGIIERTGDDTLGPRDTIAGVSYLTDVVQDKARLTELLASKPTRGKKVYPNMLWDALESGRVTDIRMLASSHGFLPGYDASQKLSIKVLGPVTEPHPDNGKPLLRWFGDNGKTKNGHSIVLRVSYGDVHMLLGGDLNIPAEYHLLSHHTQMEVPHSPHTPEAEDAVVTKAREVFRSDIAKACHHGSADFSRYFLRAVDATATIISSGDAEPHSHPRADSLGTVGRWSRSARTLIFSTELARSAQELIKHPSLLRTQFMEAQKKIGAATTAEEKKKAEEAYEDLVEGLQRSIAVYGAINVRTDGKRVVIAQRIEAPRSKDKKWDIYMLEVRGDAGLQFLSKHDD